MASCVGVYATGKVRCLAFVANVQSVRLLTGAVASRMLICSSWLAAHTHSCQRRISWHVSASQASLSCQTCCCAASLAHLCIGTHAVLLAPSYASYKGTRVYVQAPAIRYHDLLEHQSFNAAALFAWLRTPTGGAAASSTHSSKWWCCSSCFCDLHVSCA